LHEIFIPILEMRTSTLKQKAVILGMLSRLCQDPQALVEIYLNYDCDSEAVDNIYEQLVLSMCHLNELDADRLSSLMNIVSKIGTTPFTAAQQKANEPASPASSHTAKIHHLGTPPSLSTSALAVSGTMDTSVMGLSENQLKRQGLECLVAVLRSLVAWGTAAGKTAEDALVAPYVRSQTGEDLRHDSATPDVSLDKLSVAGSSAETLRQATPDPVDDPSKFESAKQKKTTLLEGIKKFNFKPKRVSVFFLRRNVRSSNNPSQGIQFLIDTGYIPSKSPQDVANFLLSTDGLSKGMIGEYLGEG
jgi:brefeldin A-inhibited guanine nucleotide-exchange protein